MSNSKNYQTLVVDHRGLLRFSRNLVISGGALQCSLLIFANAWLRLGFPCYRVGTLTLFAWCLFQFVKDFFTSLKVDRYGCQLTLDGVSLENKNACLGRYFHEVLEDFNFLKIFIFRSSVNFFALGFLGYFSAQLISKINPDLVIGHRALTLAVGLLITITSAIYYACLKPVDKKKRELELVKSATLES